MRSATRTSRLLALAGSVALTASACGGGQAAANEDLEDQVAQAKELAYQAALSAEEAKNAAAEALLAAGGGGTGAGEQGTGTTTTDHEAEAADGHGDGDGETTGTTADHGEEHATETTAANGGDTAEIHWGYSGEMGPDHWASISEDFATCETGMEQSPIDLMGRSLNVGLDDIATHWAPSTLEVVDNGHTIQANVQPGNTTTIDGVEYELVQFHFHKPSEHTVNTEVFPMELHFVHKNSAGGLAVVGVLVTVGEPNPAYDVLWGAQPAEADQAGTVVPGFDLNQLLPASMHSYRYPGSLTTPPCSEGVSWNVLSEPVTVSQLQIDGFRYDHNNRSVQDIHDRLVLVDKS